MNTEQDLKSRSESKCELCSSSDSLHIYAVAPKTDESADNCILICSVCQEQVEDPAKININHWRCLNDSMWSQIPAVQVMAWRMLKNLSGESWAQDLLEMLYLEEDILAWAEAASKTEETAHKDCNGTKLEAGDTVTLIKDLNVKGSSLIAKRGTAVRGISLSPDNPEHIEGKVEGQRIVIITKYIKKN